MDGVYYAEAKCPEGWEHWFCAEAQPERIYDEPFQFRAISFWLGRVSDGDAA